MFKKYIDNRVDELVEDLNKDRGHELNRIQKLEDKFGALLKFLDAEYREVEDNSGFFRFSIKEVAKRQKRDASK